MITRLYVFLALAAAVWSQQAGSIEGTVRLAATGQPMHNVVVTVLPLGRNAETADDGSYKIANLAPGTYTVLARVSGLSAEPQQVTVSSSAATADFTLAFDPLRQQVTVTASGRQETTLASFLPVTTIETAELAPKAAPSLGEVLNRQPGIAMRSFGPGNTRPVVRGYDGDRVLILQDGIRTGSVSSQSGDHGEPMDVTSLERIEVVRGPATLLYGSNAIGGVVNAISRHDLIHQHPHEGLKGYVTGLAGNANANGGGSGGLEYGFGNWLVWGSGGGQRTGEYNTPIGKIHNSQTRLEQGSGGLGRYSDKSFFSFSYGLNQARYGVPSSEDGADEHGHEDAVLALRRHSFRLNGGAKNMESGLDRVQLTLNYSDYNHRELIDGETESHFFNKQFIYRTVFDQKRKGPLSGSFGFWGLRRDFKSVGEEALSPPVDQDAFAAFAVQSLDFESTRLQFGGRLEHTRYSPEGLRNRSFTGFSGSAGVSQRVATNSVFVANYSHSYRAPALEELYNKGPHPGNLTFEIGNPNLVRERSDGVDLSLRHQSRRLRAEAGYFYYRNSDFVYLAPTGEIEDALPEAEYLQANARYTGAEARLDAALHPSLWLNLGFDAVSARLTSADTPLPRIPPVRGHVGLDYRYKNFSLRPELALSRRQGQVFLIEEPTAGFGVFNLSGSYTVVGQHALHVFSASLFNASNRLYRNHLSFIKEFAPEIGRGFRLTYTVRFF